MSEKFATKTRVTALMIMTSLGINYYRPYHQAFNGFVKSLL